VDIIQLPVNNPVLIIETTEGDLAAMPSTAWEGIRFNSSDAVRLSLKRTDKNLDNLSDLFAIIKTDIP
jgi:hypothetical protein